MLVPFVHEYKLYYLLAKLFCTFTYTWLLVVNDENRRNKYLSVKWIYLIITYESIN